MNSLFDVKSARLDVLSLQLHSHDFDRLETALEQRLKQLGDFAALPFVLDIADVQASDVPLERLIRLFRRHGLQLVGLRHHDEHMAQLAAKFGLSFSLLPEDAAEKRVQQRANDWQASEPATAKEPASPAAAASHAPSDSNLLSDRLAAAANITRFNEKPSVGEAISHSQANPTVVIRQPIRTGQQVYAENADLIVLGMVSVGAEIIADGNIHVYAPLRGRALAGAAGNKKARIFVQNMQAELVSVAGVYRTFERDLPDDLRNQAVQVYLDDDKLIVGALNPR